MLFTSQINILNLFRGRRKRTAGKLLLLDFADSGLNPWLQANALSKYKVVPEKETGGTSKLYHS